MTFLTAPLSAGRCYGTPLRQAARLTTLGAAVNDPKRNPIASINKDRNSTFGWLRDILIPVAVSLSVIMLFYPPVRVEGTSMVPMLQDQDRLLINKLAYRMGAIHRGDVVVFQYPRDTSKSYIKRVIALPGDRLRIEHGRVFVNEQELTEPYVPARYADERSEPQLQLASGEYYMMGDHRSISSDSRDFGPVQRSLIYGKAAFVYWPFAEAGVVH